MNPDNTVFDAKRLIGRRFDDSAVQSDMKHWPFKVINDGGKPKIQVEYKNEVKAFYPEEISSMVLVKMKETAEAYLGKVVLFSVLYFAVHMILQLGSFWRPFNGFSTAY
jgi:heat shock 70kDa protein 1/2/6/8